MRTEWTWGRSAARLAGFLRGAPSGGTLYPRLPAGLR
jgi:hypothetical protein